MLNLIFSIIALMLVHQPVSALAAETRSKYPSTTYRISQHHDYIRKNKANDFWSFMPYYASQKDGSACGIASITMLINAAKSHQNLTSDDKLITQNSLLDQVKIDYSKGLTLEQLRQASQLALKHFGLAAEVELVHAENTALFEKNLKNLLKKNESGSKDFILANFDQAIYTDDTQEFGHISPVIAYNSSKNEVLVADVDRDYYEPYWISFNTFLKGMQTTDPVSKKKRGLIYIKLNQ
jgi:hypothetical protein